MKALYCYFGRFTDHCADIPGHPLYQLFFLKSLKKKFSIDSFDVFYYDHDIYDYSVSNYSILKDYRRNIESELIRKNDISLQEVLDTKYDVVFLKYRFRNLSRLKDRCLDRYYFEMIYNNKKNVSWIIDSDDMIQEPYENIITYFWNKHSYHTETKNIKKVIPVQYDDIITAINIIKDENNGFLLKDKNKLTFIGNEYFKVGLHDLFIDIHSLDEKLNIIVQGKWNKYQYISKIIPRIERKLGYLALKNSICSIQKSKESYLVDNFLSPRIFESWLLGTLIFSENSFMPKFSSFKTSIELSEKIKFLNEIDNETYSNLLFNEILEFYNNIIL